MKTIISKSLEETKKLAKDWLLSLPPKTDEATIVGLYGNLGSGKTTFTQIVAKEMGIKEIVTSPTFVIEKIYEIDSNAKMNLNNEVKNKKIDLDNKIKNTNNFARLIHIDAYRLEKGSELQALNFEELVDNPNNLIIIEWPENVKEILTENHIKIYCEFVDENTRKFTFYKI